MKTVTYEVTLLIPSPLSIGLGIGTLYLLGVWIYDVKTRDNGGGWLFKAWPRWWAWFWPLVGIVALYIFVYVSISDYFNRRR